MQRTTTLRTLLPALLLLLFLTLTILSPPSSTTQLKQTHCPIRRPLLSEVSLPPTWQASFPGSGSRMTYSLIRSLTGLQSGDDYDSHNVGIHHVVVVKTHYPVKTARGKFDELDVNFKRAIVLLRNPKDAIPSHFNLLYERKYGLPSHSTRGTEEDWVEYRDDPNNGFGVQIQIFERFVEYWMGKEYEIGNLLLVSYEELTDEKSGPAAALLIANFLGKSDGVYPVDSALVPCVWRTVVKYKDVSNGDGGGGGSKFHSLRVGDGGRPYTEAQVDEMLGALRRLKEKFSGEKHLVRILDGYIEAMENQK